MASPSQDDRTVYLQLGARLHALRRAKGLQQLDLARRLNVSPTLISRWESAQRPVSVPDLLRLAAVLDVTVLELLDLPTPSALQGDLLASVQVVLGALGLKAVVVLEEP